ncbi:STAS domain-containing protein [Nocardioides sp. 31GB23]|uniref:STAS domain-containing protein n=1 Tax=Nocardioides sp. 31GB23 TaxID=3156065 RepID=UPI0032AFB182
MSTIITTHAGTMVVHLATGLSCYGEIDIAIADQLVADCGQQLAELALPAGSVFVVDLSGVTFMDSAGLDALLDLRDLVEEFDLVCVVRRASAAVHRIVALTAHPEQLGWLDVPNGPGLLSPA